jgi:hypothetical protein
MLLTTFDFEEETMRAILRHRPTPAMVVACIALGVALGGTSYAAIRLPAGSVGAKQLKKNAVTSPKVKNNAITGADVRESTLAQVPSAANATSATNATHATSADHATNANSATTAGTANAAFSTFLDGALGFPDELATIATLNIPAAGNYVINAKLSAFNISGTRGSPGDVCALSAGIDRDEGIFDVDAPGVDGANDTEVVALQLVHQFAAPGQVVLDCTDFGLGDVYASFPRVTAVQVAQLTNTPFDG